MAKVCNETPSKSAARLTLIVDFEPDIQDSEIEEIVDAARNYGTVRTADFEVLTPFTRSFK